MQPDHGNSTRPSSPGSPFDLFGNTYTVYHSKWIPSDENNGNGANFTRLSDPRMDKALDDLFGATDQAEAVALAQRSSVSLPRCSRRRALLPEQRPRRQLQPQNYLQNPGTATDMWNVGDWYLRQ